MTQIAVDQAAKKIKMCQHLKIAVASNACTKEDQAEGEAFESVS
jgi:hypothetical protein